MHIYIYPLCITINIYCVLIKGGVSILTLFKNRLFIYLTIISIIFCVLIIRKPEIIENLEILFFDSNTNKISKIQNDEDIKIIIVGDKTIEALGDYPFDRKYNADLLNGPLINANAVAFDFLYVSPTTKESDDSFAEAIKAHENIVLAYAEKTENTEESMPIESLLNSADYIGFVNYEFDPDKLVRKYKFAKEVDGILRPSFIYATLMAAGYDCEILDKKIVISKNEQIKSIIPINSQNQFYNMPVETDFTSVYEYIDVLDGTVSPSTFDDKIVIIGGSFSGAFDTITTPRNPIMGIRYMAENLLTVLSSKNPTRLNDFIQIIIGILLIILTSYITQKSKVRVSVLTLITIIISTILINRALMVYLLTWNNTIYNVIAIIITYITTILYLYFQKKAQTDAFQIPFNAIIELNENSNDSLGFENYLKTIEFSIIKVLGFTLVKPIINETDKIFTENFRNDIDYQNVSTNNKFVLIPLSKFKNRSERTYCLLKSINKINNENVKQVSVVILSAHVYYRSVEQSQQRNQLFLGVIKSMMAAIDSKDPITSGHSSRVSEIARSIAIWMGLPDEQVETITFAGTIHDIGKIGISDKVLNKPSFFSYDDFVNIKEHPSKGIFIVETIDVSDDLRTGISQHHERLDGKGYPKGLKGKEISLTARIIKVADVYDALVNERSYKKPWPAEKAFNLLYNGKGTEFDPEVVDAFLKNMAPTYWTPTIESDGQQGKFNDFYMKIATDTYLMCNELSADTFDKNPLSIDFDIKVSNNKFTNIEFGEDFTKKEWLYKTPVFAYCNEDTESLYYLNENTGTVKKIYYIFIRGYLTVGCIQSGTGEDKIKFDELVMETLGPIFQLYNGCKIWNLGSLYAVYYNDINNLSTIVYIHKSIVV